MDNKFFILCVLSLFFADVRGTNPLPGIESFGCDKTASDAFWQRVGIDNFSVRENPQSKNILNTLDTASDAFWQRVEIDNFSARENPQSKNILNMLDEEKVRVISKAIGKDYVTRADMVCYLRYLKFNFPLKRLEGGGDVFAVIDKRWSWLKNEMEKQELTWIDIKSRYEAAVKQNLFQIFKKEFDHNSAESLFFSMKRYIESLGENSERIGNSRFVRKGCDRVWQEMYDHWSVIKGYIPGYLLMLHHSGRI